MRHGERPSNPEAAQNRESRADQVRSENRLAVSRGQSVHRAECDSEGQDGEERDPIPRRCEGAKVCADRGIDPPLQANQEIHDSSPREGL